MKVSDTWSLDVVDVCVFVVLYIFCTSFLSAFVKINIIVCLEMFYCVPCEKRKFLKCLIISAFVAKAAKELGALHTVGFLMSVLVNCALIAKDFIIVVCTCIGELYTKDTRWNANLRQRQSNL